MKIAIITDQHFGARNDSIHFLDYYEKFYKNTFFPTLDNNGINTVLILGDTFDRRKYVNFYSLKRTKDMFFDELAKRNIQVHMLAGNHDTYFKNTNEVNSIDLLLKEYTNIKVIDKPTTIWLDNEKYPICMMPWICPENHDDSMFVLSDTDANICMGHFEIAGFAMHRGMPSHEGLDRGLFKKFSTVFSGHYHHRSNQDNIRYLGKTEGVDDDMINEAEDTITIINKFVDGISEEHIDNDKLKTVLKELYVEALNQEQA